MLVCILPIVILVIFNSIDISYSWAQSLSTVSTRGHFDTITRESLSNGSYNQVDPDFFNNICTNSEILIYVHGVWTNPSGHIPTSAENAEEIFNRLRMSLDYVGYEFPLIGFSWDSNTTIDKDGVGWNIAKYIAKENGPKLAKFISDLKENCMNQTSNDIQVRLVGHSLGSRVILSSLNSLNNNHVWNENGFKILTVNLLGGAVDAYEVLKGNVEIPLDSGNIKHYYGIPIEKQVLKFYNMYNSEDDVLEQKVWEELGEPIYYPWYESFESAIGQDPLSEGTFGMPENYKNVDVKNDLIDEIDADNDAAVLGNDGCDLLNVLTTDDPSDCIINGEGDNHLGYIGFRNLDNSLLNEGAIDKVVETWRMS